jgi:ADP-ribosylglycohydrolase
MPDFVSDAQSGLQLLFIADALSMPVHWYYDPGDIFRQFPGGIQGFEAAPAQHPSSIMNLHSTSGGGRGGQRGSIVGDVILKGRKDLWGQPGIHYHHGLPAGENTLNAYCARLMLRHLAAGEYDGPGFLEAYVAFMTADPPQHPDTYAESFHRGFFANWRAGKALTECGAVTHDTPSIGGLVMIGALALTLLARGMRVDDVGQAARTQLGYTHPDEGLAVVCDAYVELLHKLLLSTSADDAREQIAAAAASTAGAGFTRLLHAPPREDATVVGGKYSLACYIDSSWPVVLYLAHKYLDDPLQGLLQNTNLGGENCHRGAVLGTILGAASGCRLALFDQLLRADLIQEEIAAALHKHPTDLESM